MNFFIGDKTTLTGFTQVAPRLFLDQGWTNVGDIWYKGHSTECTISEHINDIVDGYKPAGNWCAIQNEQIFHPVLRGFPVFTFENNLTTLKIPGYEPVIYDSPPAPKVTDNDILSVEEVSYQIGNILLENIENFYRYSNPKNVNLYVSPGLDTITCWSILDHVTTDYDLRIYFSGEDKFTPEYTHDIMKSLMRTRWGPNQVTYKKEPSWTITGFFAETYTYRDIAAATGYMKFLGKQSLTELVTPDDYYYGFLDRPNLTNVYNRLKDGIDVSTTEKLRDYLWSTIWYENQIWHLDNNMFFSPFADLRIPEIALRLSIEDLLKFSVNGTIQRHIIERFAPDKLALLSKYKNYGEVWKNFHKNFKRSMVGEKTNFIVI